VRPADIQWKDWVAFATDLGVSQDATTLYEVNRRYRYGELRLLRLNTLYHFGLAGFSFHNVVYGFMSRSIRYTTFFEPNFAWMLAVFVYVTVVLSAMQVALATERFGSSDPFQQFSYGLALLSIAFVFVAVLIMLFVWWSLFWFHLLSTIRYYKKVTLQQKQSSQTD
jgi:hypothetical protein